MTETVIASDGTPLPINDLPIAFGYSGNNVTSFTVNYNNINGESKTYVQTLTYAGDNVINISRWIPQ